MAKLTVDVVATEHGEMGKPKLRGVKQQSFTMLTNPTGPGWVRRLYKTQTVWGHI